MLKLSGTDIVSPDMVFVCQACGKTSNSKFGFDRKGRRCAQLGWDTSCMMNCVLLNTKGDVIEYEST
jgi:hypothetical protein